MLVSFAKSFVIASFSYMALFALSSAPAWSAVETISDKENFAQYGQENAYWTVDVRCQGASSESTIQRKTDGTMWCARNDESLCSETKSGAAEQVCSDAYIAAQQARQDEQRKQEREQQQRREQAERERRETQRQLAAQRQREAQQRIEAAGRPSVSSANIPNISEKISIEEQRLSIEKQRLELRRREVQLEQRAAEIQTLLKGVE